MFEIINANTIKIASKQIKLPCSIFGYQQGNPRVVEFQNIIAVNFVAYDSNEAKSIDDNIDMARNIWAFDQKGNMLWQVASLGTKFPKLHTTYTYVSIKDEKLIGGNWAGYDVEINPKDGSIKLYPENPGRSW